MLPGQAAGDEKQGDEELRKVTVIFSDLSGYTSLSERLGPEETKAITSRIFSECAAIARKYEGRLDRLVGDCALILFGIPHLHEDDAVRALMAAMEIHAFVDSLNSPDLITRVGRSLAMHTGVNTGTVVAGRTDFEAGTETVVGDPVNLASRLKDAAKAGQLLVGPLCWRYTQEEFEYRALEPLYLKGKEKPVQAFELLSRKPKAAQRKPEALNREVHSQLVGREKELELLERRAFKLTRGEGSIVFVRGEAGVGKSRLLIELRMKELMGRVALLEGSAQSIGKNLSFHPFIEMLNTWAGIREEDGEGETRRKLEAAIREAAQEEGEEIFPFVAVMRGLKLEGAYAERVRDVPGDALSKLIAKSVRDLIRALSRQKPVILLLEDLHWADQSSLELLEGLFRLVREERVCFIAALRPSEPNTEMLVRKAQESYGERSVLIDLPTLSGSDSEQMVSNLLRNRVLSKNVLDSLVERTGGNPFFIEEIVRSWIDEGSVSVSKEGFQITERIEQTDIPYTIDQAIMARIDRLGEETREVLRIAAVIGRSFFYRIIVQLAANIGSLDSKIEYLKGIQLIVERRRLEEVEYLFKHALAQEAIYDSILLQVRKSLHLSVARAIESIFAERVGEFAGMLALHYTRGEDYDKAEQFMIRAGEEALKAAGSAEAITYYRDALDLYLKKQGVNADPAKVVTLKKNIARSLYYRGRYAEALPLYDPILRYYGILVPKNRLGLVFSAVVGLARFLFWLYGPERRKLKPLTSQLREGIVLYIEKISTILIVDASTWFLHGFVLTKLLIDYDVSDFDPGLGQLVARSSTLSLSGLSLSLGRKVLDKMSRVVGPNQPSAWIRYLVAKSVYCYIAGEWKERKLFYDPSLEKQAEQGLAFDVLSTNWFSGLACIECGDWDTYLDSRHMLEMISDRFDNDYGRGCLHILTFRYYIKRRMMEEASSYIPVFLEFFSKVSTSFGEIGPVWTHAWLSRVELLGGDFEAAAAHLKRIPVAIARSPRVLVQTGFFCWAYAALAVEKARCTTKDGKLDRQTRRECLFDLHWNLKNARKFAPDRTEALKFMGSYSWHTGAQRRAISYWQRSIREGERLGAKVELAHTFTDAGKLLGEMTPGPEWRKRGAELYLEFGIGGE
jgi:class 3 adenylate cyclase/tetratricopeptide (TPR) repeat protein